MDHARITSWLLCGPATFFAALGCVAPGTVHADDARSRSTRASITLSAMDFGYKEFSDTGRLLDQEYGVLPGIGIALEWSRQAWVVWGGISYYAGTVTYDGQTNLGNPISTDTATTLWDGQVRLGRHFGSEAGQITPYLGFAYHYWNRDILPTQTASGRYVSGLNEIYRWYSFDLGILAMATTHVPGLRIGLDVRGFQIKRPTMELMPANGYDGTTLALGEERGWYLGLPIDYSLNGSTALRVELYAETWGFGRSATQKLTSGGVVVGSVYEPQSETRVYGLVIGLNRQF